MGPSKTHTIRRMLEAFAGTNFTTNNSITRLKNGAEIFPAMITAIENATDRIDFVTFVYWTGEPAERLATALAERARAGVAVRVLIDAVGGRRMSEQIVERLEEAGCEVRIFRPVTRWKVWENDHRTHRKILVVDNTVGFTGGVGIAHEWDGDARNEKEWRDSQFEIRGAAIDPLRAAFLSDWRDAGGETTPGVAPQAPNDAGTVTLAVVDASAQIELNNAGRVIELLVQQAQQRLWITTPYFNPPDRLSGLLADAAQRGVDVRIMIPGPHIDKRVSALLAQGLATELVDRGVKFYRYLPTMLHLKQLIIDDETAMIGSVNLNERSLYKDEEVAVVVLDDEFVSTLAADFTDDEQHCEKMTSLEDLQQPAAKRALATVLTPFRSEL